MPDSKDTGSAIWQVISRQTLYEYLPFLNLEKQSIRLPDGQVINDYHRLDMPESCAVCPLTTEGKVVTLRGYKHGVGSITSFLPGGLVDSDESPMQAAKRELLEETGYVAEQWIAMGSYIPNSSYGCGRVHLFKTKDATQAIDPDPGDLEAMDVEVVDLKTIIEWIRNGQVQSLSAVTAVALAVGEIL